MDTIRKAEYYYVTIPDKPGEGERLFGALRDAGVNLLAVHAFPSARRSQIDLVPSDAAAFLAAAKAAKLKVSKPKTVFLIEGDDRVGAMAQLPARRRGNQRDRDECHPHGDGPLRRPVVGQGPRRQEGRRSARRVTAPTDRSGVSRGDPQLWRIHMASRTERFKTAAVKAARTARKWAQTAAREADRLLQEAQKRAKTDERQRRIKAALRRTGKVLKAAGRAAIVAGVAAGIASARAENRKLRKKRR